jgi:hypothetical protein
VWEFAHVSNFSLGPCRCKGWPPGRHNH